MKKLLYLFYVLIALALLIVVCDNSIPTDEDESTYYGETTYDDYTTTIPEDPTTDIPTTESPSTEAPTTEAPTTEAPTTETPTTELPTTEAPTTELPTTEAPTTEAPTTTVPGGTENPDRPPVITTVTVSFDSAGGSSVPSQTLDIGEKATKPSDPTKAGYIFDGWYSEGEKWEFDKTIIVTDITLFAKWVPDRSYIPDAVGKMDDNFEIKLTSSSLTAESYILKYEDENGVMSNYEDIGTLSLSTPYKGFISGNTAPVGAVKIGVYTQSGRRMGSIGIIDAFKPNLGDKKYSFGALSDVHIGYSTSEEDFERALKYLSDIEKVKFIGVAGDLTTRADSEQFYTFRSLIEKHSKVPVYAIAGNHDTPEYGGSMATEFVEKYTGHPLYYSFTEGEDVYIMLGVAEEATGAHMAPGALQWLYETLEANKDKRCFIFTHVYPNNSSGDPFDIYGFDMWKGTEEQIFMSMLNHYPNVTVFHGHSHIEFALQSLSDKAIIDINGKFNSIHIPSLAAPRTCKLEDGVITENHYLYEESEGYVVDVYENCIVLRGYDFVNGKFIPYAQYYIDTTLKTVEAGTYYDPTDNIRK